MPVTLAVAALVETTSKVISALAKLSRDCPIVSERLKLELPPPVLATELLVAHVGLLFLEFDLLTRSGRRPA